jgi:hypothetical protein
MVPFPPVPQVQFACNCVNTYWGEKRFEWALLRKFKRTSHALRTSSLSSTVFETTKKAFFMLWHVTRKTLSASSWSIFTCKDLVFWAIYKNASKAGIHEWIIYVEAATERKCARNVIKWAYTFQLTIADTIKIFRSAYFALWRVFPQFK